MMRYFDYTDLLGWHLGNLAAAMLASTIKIQGRLHDIEREGWRMVKYECVATFMDPIAVRLDYRIALEKEDFPAPRDASARRMASSTNQSWDSNAHRPRPEKRPSRYRASGPPAAESAVVSDRAPDLPDRRWDGDAARQTPIAPSHGEWSRHCAGFPLVPAKA